MMELGTVSKAQTCFCCCFDQSKHRETGRVGVQIAEYIDTVAGLREAITWKNKPLKIVWILLVLTGIGGTLWLLYQTTAEYFEETIATKVSMEPQEAYEYPPLVICPPAWYDSKKARALGISVDAIKYSLGYFADLLAELPMSDLEMAKKHFRDQYQNLNFSSLDAYFKAIAIDLKWTKTIVEAMRINDTSSVYRCSGCTDSKMLQKLFFAGGMCYAISLKPQNASNSRITDNSSPTIWIGVQDLSEGIAQPMVLNHIRLYTIPNSNLTPKNPTTLPIRLKNPGLYSIIVSAKRFNDRKGGADCFDNDQVSPHYFPELCYATCMNAPSSHKNGSGECYWFVNHPYTPDASQLHPAKYCNLFDYLDGNPNYYELADIILSKRQRITQSSQGQSCVKKCPPKCERTLYELQLLSSVSVVDLNAALLRHKNPTSAVWNMSWISLEIAHQAVMQGGILTMKQFNTITPAGFISNVGGALGLFVGATTMTLAQVIMFLIKSLIDKFKSRRLEFG